MAIEGQWNQPELVEAFEDWRLGQASNRDMELLESPAPPRYIQDLRIGAQDLLRHTGEESEHHFSDAAMQAVRQDRDVYLNDASVPKFELHQASVIMAARGETRFAQIYNTRLSADDILRRMQRDSGGFNEFISVESNLGQPYSTEQRVHRLYVSKRPGPTGKIIRRYPRDAEGASAQILPAELTVADYITLGHLIEHDLNS